MDIAKYIDHTLLKPTAERKDIEKLCKEAREYNFASVCVNPCWVSYASKLLEGSSVKVCTVIGFPLGANTSAVKAFEAKTAIQEGASEVDMVINIGALKAGQYDLVKQDIEAVRKASVGKILKVIIETSYLTNEEKQKVCKICAEVGADFVKTSTGFSGGGATAQDVALMAKSAGEKVKVKASGGIRTREDALKMIEAGASRLGTSSGIKIV